MLSSNAVRDPNASCTVTATSEPGGTFAAEKRMRKPLPGATHGLWPASTNDGAAACATAGAGAATTPPAIASATTASVTKPRATRLTTCGRAPRDRSG